jgi:HPt (histidine-containing phosphotransfer) domain-containing protein
MNFDLKTALSNLGGSVKLYRTLIAGFVDKYSHIDNQIYELLLQRKTEEARRMAHSIKGLSGNLGVEDLRNVALNLELDIKNYLEKEIMDEDIERIIETTWKEFSLILNKLNPMLHILLSTNDENLLEAAQLNDISMIIREDQVIELPQEFILTRNNPDDSLKQLLKALNSYNYELIEEALLSFDDTRLSEQLPATWNELKKAIKNYEYDVAKELIVKGIKDED